MEEVTKPDEPDFDLPVVVKSVDLNRVENRRAHHTDNYDDAGLIVRRGQAFSLIVTTKTPLPAKTKLVSRATFQLATDTYRLSKRYTFEVDTVATVQGTRTKIELKTPADVAVGT